MKLYLVWQSSGEYDSYYNSLIGVFTSKEKAEEVKRIYDARIVRDGEIFTIVPEDVYLEWEYDDDTNEYAETFQGYTNEQREAQDLRMFNAYENINECVIEVRKTDSYYDYASDTQKEI